ncbi:predicted protein [Sclerotinia sclerotiorum 1980 UF-70]|uniref:Uncharacterized protein n=2 Tax=Sclerotinia sclerotiorum (strain ATCC 18683 / 1980 / Ss-1) TaxID=665079 RepID=A7EI30_SCLS1|nr:predicted protein [Sclerotinia sclerotiorum 1980 UF-70]APA11548.1 hypothetical protein sscle_08g063180 [Sclerotinia sclerotiorum 1980 UF-70]EDO02496.1 predicted protein [Sclerotinia sclerotiorum 1980 UF-70]
MDPGLVARMIWKRFCRGDGNSSALLSVQGFIEYIGFWEMQNAQDCVLPENQDAFQILP